MTYSKYWLSLSPEEKKIKRKEYNDRYEEKHPDKARQWIPCYDYPNDKATNEMIVTVDKKYKVLSNGKLAGVKENSLVRRHRIALRIRPTAIVPDDFRAEHRLA